jgi:hypothetical protein
MERRILSLSLEILLYLHDGIILLLLLSIIGGVSYYLSDDVVGDRDIGVLEGEKQEGISPCFLPFFFL